MGKTGYRLTYLMYSDFFSWIYKSIVFWYLVQLKIVFFFSLIIGWCWWWYCSNVGKASCYWLPTTKGISWLLCYSAWNEASWNLLKEEFSLIGQSHVHRHIWHSIVDNIYIYIYLYIIFLVLCYLKVHALLLRIPSS